MNDMMREPIAQITRNGAVNNPECPADARFPFYMGIELELEQVRTPDGGHVDRIPQGWTTHADESLRNGIEFVTNGPQSHTKLMRSIVTFFNSNYTYQNTPRTSTHIHVNVSDMTVGQVATMFVMSYALEDALFRTIERGRKYCGYCMPLSEMTPARVQTLLAPTNMHEYQVRGLGGNNAEKYYGFNLNSIRKHGTAEFRYFPGGPTREELENWMDYCTSIRRMGMKYSLEDLAAITDGDAFAAFLRENLPSHADRMIGIVGQDAIFHMMAEALAMAAPRNGPVRRDSLVFVRKPLVRLIQNVVCGGVETDSAKAFEEKSKKLSVVSRAEWDEMVQALRYPSKKGKDKLFNIDELYTPPGLAGAGRLSRAAERAAPPRRPVFIVNDGTELLADQYDPQRGINNPVVAWAITFAPDTPQELGTKYKNAVLKVRSQDDQIRRNTATYNTMLEAERRGDRPADLAAYRNWLRTSSDTRNLLVDRVASVLGEIQRWRDRQEQVAPDVGEDAPAPMRADLDRWTQINANDLLSRPIFR